MTRDSLLFHEQRNDLIQLLVLLRVRADEVLAQRIQERHLVNRIVQLILHLGDALILFLVPCILLIHPAFDEKRECTNQQTDGSRNRPEYIFLHSFHPNQKSRSLSVAAIVAQFSVPVL